VSRMPADVSYLDSRYRFDERHEWQFNLVDSVAVAAVDGRPVVVAGGLDGGVRVIDMTDGGRVCEFVPEGEFRATAVATTELQGHPVAVSGHNHGALRLIDMAAGRLLREWQFADGAIYWISGLAVIGARDRTLIAAATSDERIRLWDLSDGTLVGERSDRKLEVMASVHSYIRKQGGLPPLAMVGQPQYPSLSLTCLTAAGLRGRPLLVAGYGDGTLYVCDLESGEGIWGPDAELAHRGLGAYVDSLGVCDFRGRPVIVAGAVPA
jgi:WD40 repeat protein